VQLDGLTRKAASRRAPAELEIGFGNLNGQLLAVTLGVAEHCPIILEAREAGITSA
jgi:hypothetical protein